MKSARTSPSLVIGGTAHIECKGVLRYILPHKPSIRYTIVLLYAIVLLCNTLGAIAQW